MSKYSARCRDCAREVWIDAIGDAPETLLQHELKYHHGLDFEATIELREEERREEERLDAEATYLEDGRQRDLYYSGRA